MDAPERFSRKGHSLLQRLEKRGTAVRLLVVSTMIGVLVAIAVFLGIDKAEHSALATQNAIPRAPELRAGDDAASAPVADASTERNAIHTEVTPAGTPAAMPEQAGAKKAFNVDSVTATEAARAQSIASYPISAANSGSAVVAPDADVRAPTGSGEARSPPKNAASADDRPIAPSAAPEEPRRGATQGVDTEGNDAPDLVATDAERWVSVVLELAAKAEQPAQTRAVVEAAANARPRPSASSIARQNNPGLARKLNDEARKAFWDRQNIQDAVVLERKAFEANPRDVEIAGNLAFLYLKLSPPEPQRARELALHALTLSAPQFRTGRLEDWTTLAVADAITGRTGDATNAFHVTAALSKDLDRTCRAALNAVVSYGEAVKNPATVMLSRINAQGRSHESPYCAWPPNWAMGRKYP